MSFKNSMLRRAALALAALAFFSAPAGALEMMAWDNSLQTKLAYAQTGGGKEETVLRGEVLDNVRSPAVILFSLSGAERNQRAFAGLQSRYEGELKNGKLAVRLPGGTQELDKFLSGYGLKLKLDKYKGNR